jgi:23S rRNA A1618 N6-methylase RlmF
MRNNINFFCDMGKSSYIFDIYKEHLKNEENVKPLITLITKSQNKTTIGKH